MGKFYPRNFHLQSGTIIIGFISVILSLHSIINKLFVEEYFENVYERNEKMRMLGIFPNGKYRLLEAIMDKDIIFDPSFFIPHVLTYGIGIIGYIAFPFIYFFISAIFLWASIVKNKWGMLMWYVLAVISVALNIGALIFAHVMYPLPPVYLALHHLLFYGLEIYFITIVKSFCNQLGKDIDFIEMKRQQKISPHEVVPLETDL